MPRARPKIREDCILKNQRSEEVIEALINRLFMAQDARPEELEPVQMEGLSPFQRVLLVTDGTVTQVLEARMGEPVDVVRLDQRERRLTADHPWLEAGLGEPVIDRQVLLKGNHTGEVYIFAISALLPRRLPEEVQADLARPGAGLGRVLARSRLETHRERLWYGAERVERDSEVGRHFSAELLLSRTYRILAGGRPLMLITEKFPLPNP